MTTAFNFFFTDSMLKSKSALGWKQKSVDDVKLEIYKIHIRNKKKAK